MSKEMREQINKVKNWKQFLNEDVSINFTENQKRLREYNETTFTDDGNMLLPAVILSLGFKLENDKPTSVYLHTKHNVRLQKLFTGGTAYRFEIAHDWDLDSGVVYEWTRLKTVETKDEIKELFFVLWGTSL